MLKQDQPWDDLYIPFDYTHLNRTGLHIAAKLLLAAIEGNGYLDSARGLPKADTQDQPERRQDGLAG